MQFALTVLARLARRRRRPSAAVFGVLFVANLLFSFHLFFTTYINSSFLGQFLPSAFVGLVFTGASLAALLSFASVTRLLRRMGNHRLLVLIATVQVFALLGLALAQSAFLVVALFTLIYTNALLLIYIMDIFLESLTKDENATGTTRGIFLTMYTIGGALSPLLVGFILGQGENFRIIYFISAIFLIPFTLLLGFATRTFSDRTYAPFRVRTTLVKVWCDFDLRAVVAAQSLLRFFYAWMVIYTPLYLVREVGVSWKEFGIIMSIALTAFIITEYPAGWVADRLWGEKELMAAGFGILILTLLAIPLLATVNPLWWAVLLFANRVGASFIEITTESYFFKHVDGGDANLISLFRMTRPFAYVIAPLLASLILFFAPLAALFPVLALFMLWGVLLAFRLRDTR